jgi:UTP--glucose-1-phosphate uridylyltransferase
VPVKTTDDLLVLRSDCYELGDGSVLRQVPERVPFVDLDKAYYKLVDDFDRRFADGPPSLRRARSLTVHGDWTFGGGVSVVGEVVLEQPDAPGRVEPGTTLGD